MSERILESYIKADLIWHKLNSRDNQEKPKEEQIKMIEEVLVAYGIEQARHARRQFKKDIEYHLNKNDI